MQLERRSNVNCEYQGLGLDVFDLLLAKKYKKKTMDKDRNPDDVSRLTLLPPISFMRVLTDPHPEYEKCMLDSRC